MSDETKFVIAPTYQRFMSWCRENGLNHRDQRQACYVSRADKVWSARLRSERQIIDLGGDYELVRFLKTRVR